MGEIFILLSAVAYQFIWHNDNNTLYHRYFSHKNINHIGALFENNNKMRSLEALRAKLGLDDNKKICWRQIIQAKSRAWKEMF